MANWTSLNWLSPIWTSPSAWTLIMPVPTGRRGDCHRFRGEYDRAIADFDVALQLDPDEAMSYRGRGAALRRKGELDQAIADFNAAVWLDPQDIYAYRFRGDAYIAKENLPQAIRDFDVALSINPDDEVSYRRRGDAYLPSGNFDLAIAYYNGALECDPSSGPAYPTGDWSVSLWEILVARAKIAAAQESWDTTTPADRVRRRMPGTGDVERMLPSLPQAQISARD